MFTYRLETMHGASTSKEGFWLSLYKVIVAVDLRCNTLAILNPIVNAVEMVCKTRKKNY